MIKVTTVPVKTYVTKSKIPGTSYVINPYIGCPHRCIYCYAGFMRKFTGHTEPWGQFLDVKLCQTPLRPAQLFQQPVLLSSVTDAYNPFEQKYRVTRHILEQLVHVQARVSILTKSALVVRDMDLLQQLPGCEVAFSFSTADEAIRQQLEPGASPIPERLQTLQTLHKAGITTAVFAAPLLPGISDFKAIVQAAAPFTREFRFDSLNMRATFQHTLMDFIDIHYPHLLPLYNEIYLRGNRTYWEQLEQEILTYCQARHIPATVFFGKKSSFSFHDVTQPPQHPSKPIALPDDPQLF